MSTLVNAAAVVMLRNNNNGEEPLDPYAFVLLLTIADMVDPYLSAGIKIKEILRRTGMSKVKMMQCLSVIQDRGLMEWATRYGGWLDVTFMPMKELEESAYRRVKAKALGLADND